MVLMDYCAVFKTHNQPTKSQILQPDISSQWIVVNQHKFQSLYEYLYMDLGDHFTPPNTSFRSSPIWQPAKQINKAHSPFKSPIFSWGDISPYPMVHVDSLSAKVNLKPRRLSVAIKYCIKCQSTYDWWIDI